MSKNRSGLFVGGLLIGSAVGTAVGLLIAPRSGRDTRKLLQQSAEALPELADDVSATLQYQADRLSASAWRGWDDTLFRLKEAIAAGLEASQLERQILSEPETRNSEPPHPSPGDRTA
jgi:gas vesicle protein